MQNLKRMKNIIDSTTTVVGNGFSTTGKVAKESFMAISDKLSGVTLPFLSNPELLKWSEKITEGTASVYDKALDMTYLKTHIGGGNHRMFDGGHDIFNAWDRVKSAKIDDSSTEEIVGYVSAIWKDLTTKQGLPIFTWEKDNYDKWAEWFSEHVPIIDKSYFYDLMSIDIFEVIGSSIGVAALIFGLKRDDQKKVAEVIGSMGVTTIASANPLMAIALVFITAYVVMIKKNSIDKKSLIKGAVISTVSVAIFSVLGFPLLIELGIAIILTTLVRKKILENEVVLSLIDNRLNEIKEVSKDQFKLVVLKIDLLFEEIEESTLMSQLSDVKDESWNFVTVTIPSLPQQTQRFITNKIK